MCFAPAFELDTGNLSSHDHFGINAKPADRITLRRKTVCAPLITENFYTTMNYRDAMNASAGEVFGQDGDTIYFYNYGQTINLSKPSFDYTFAYNQRASTVGYGYSLHAVDFSSGSTFTRGWRPDRAIFRDDGDTSLIFIAANSIYYFGRVEDPIFKATAYDRSWIESGRNVTFYTSNYLVSPLGCVDQHQFCNPNNQRCTKLDSAYSAVTAAEKNLGVNTMQHVTLISMANLYLSIMSQSIDGRGSSALRAQELVTRLFSGPLPDDQWKKEVEYWFATGLAKLQKSAVEYAAGPGDVPEGTYVMRLNDTVGSQRCDNQKIKAPPGSVATSFSTLGVALIVGIGGLLILIHVVLELVISNIIPTRSYKLLRWASDDKLQLERLAFEGAGLGTWIAGIGAVPTTTGRESFSMGIGSGKEHPKISIATADIEGEIIPARRDSGSLNASTLHVDGVEEPHVMAEHTESLLLPPITIRNGDSGDLFELGYYTADPTSRTSPSPVAGTSTSIS